MRCLWKALVLSISGMACLWLQNGIAAAKASDSDSAGASSAQANAGDSVSAKSAPPTAKVSLHECRLQHPLRLASIAARCGLLRVPEDRANPAGADIELSIAVVPALNRRATLPPLFLLAGGPGQSAIDLYTTTAGAFAQVNRNQDIVLVDQRGTGGSAPLSCDYPDDWRETSDTLPALRSATSGCLEKLGAHVRFYTSSAAVQDLEAVRRALGYSRVDLYGSSYGTRVAQLYMRRYPASIQAAILDGVTYPEQAIGPDTPEDGQHALDLIVARCRASKDCATAFPELAQELTGLLHQFGPQKISITLQDPSDGLPQQIEFSRSLLNGGLRFLSYSATQASILPALIHQASKGNLGPLASQTIMMARQIADLLASGMQNSVVCSEDVPFFTPFDRARLMQTYQGTDQLDALLEICKIWPRGPVDADLHAPLHSDIPTLLLSGEDDPVTPPADAERAARGLTHHRHLVLRGEGHGQLATGCVPRLMAEFLGGVSPQTLDAACLDRHTPAPFFVSLTGPSP